MTIQYQFVEPYLYNEQRPFVEGQVQALDGSELIGYVKWECLSSQHFDRLFPTVWHYADEMTGWCLGLDANSDLDDPATLDRLVRGVCSYSWSLRDIDISTLTVQEKWNILDQAKDNDGIQSRFDGFKQSIDYHFVAYSRVKDGIRIFEPNTENYQRRGIGTQLYKLTAMWLAVNKQTALHSSTLIQPCAQAVWKKMVEMGAPICQRRRPETNKMVYALDYTQTSVLRAQAQRAVSAVSTIPAEKRARVA